MIRTIAGLAALSTVMVAGGAFAQAIAVPGVPCQPVARCPENDAKCTGVVAEQGNVTEPKTGRKFFLDYSCNLRPGAPAIFILNVHGIGGNANWQRHYFPALDYKDQYNLIIATGKSAGTNFTAQADDEYVLGMIDYVVKAFPGVDLKAWVAGHSAGGGYSRSFMCKPSAISGKIKGSISLAGNRVGGNRTGTPPGFAEAFARSGAAGAGAPPAAGRGGPPGGGAPPSGAPTCGEFSHIYSTGSIDSLGTPFPEASSLAVSLGCQPRTKRPNIVDTKGGHVYDARDRPAPLPGWGGVARPGTTEFFEFPGCKDGKVVADLVRLEKGHTEGLEPKVTEEILKLVAAASR